MELLEGESLRDRIKAGQIPEAQAVQWAIQIADAVAAAHHRRIVHRDLKPENVYLVGPQRDQVKVLDFGIAKLTDSQATQLTQAGTLLGTPSYMSPEQCMAKPVDARSDIYALGIILYEMATGRLPFIGEGYADLLIKQITGEAPPPRSLNPRLSEATERAILRAIEKEPEKRFQTMEEFVGGLSAEPTLRPRSISGHNVPAVRPGFEPDATIISRESNASATTRMGPGQAATKMGAAPKRGGMGALIGVIGGLVVLGGGAGFLLLRDETTAPAATLPIKGDKGGEKAGPKKMRLTVNSEPPGAEVRRADGKVLGETPFNVVLEADGSKLQLLIRKDGYKGESRDVELVERDRILAVDLTAEGERDKKRSHSSGRRDKEKEKEKKPVHLGDEILAPTGL
jgi:serine/threonine-protein kinase